MSDTKTAQDSRTAPVAVWEVLKNLKGDDLKQWRVAEIENLRSAQERNIDIPMPCGWFVLCYSDELAVGEVKSLNYFDKDLALWRGEDGKARMLDAYCAHLGAHMGHGGKVNKNNLECPFHAWRYDEEGKVTEIPYSKMIPPQVRKPCVKPYHVTEVNGYIWGWYHPEKTEPTYELEAFPECSDPNWTDYEKHEWIVYGPIQTIAENGADSAHFQYIHGVAGAPSYEITFDGHCRTAVVEAPMGTPQGTVDGKISYGVVGPGQAWTRFEGICETLMVAGVTPITKDKTHIRFAFTQHKSTAEGDRAGLSKAMIKDICKQLDQDKVVWDRQKYVDQPFLCADDGPIMDFRKFFNQFHPGNELIASDGPRVMKSR